MAMEDGCSYDSTNKMKIRQMIGVHSTVGIDLKSINVIPIQKEVKSNEMSKIININMTTGMASSELQ
jgi:hypothetical protein